MMLSKYMILYITIIVLVFSLFVHAQDMNDESPMVTDDQPSGDNGNITPTMEGNDNSETSDDTPNNADDGVTTPTPTFTTEEPTETTATTTTADWEETTTTTDTEATATESTTDEAEPTETTTTDLEPSETPTETTITDDLFTSTINSMSFTPTPIITPTSSNNIIQTSSSSLLPSSSTTDNNNNSNENSGLSSTQIKIIGGVVGGVVGLCIIAGAIVFTLKKSKKREAVDFETFNPQLDEEEAYSPRSSAASPHWSQSQYSSMAQPLTR
ncbi:unnamed protein product [Cunninghamella blakesleeana]